MKERSRTKKVDDRKRKTSRVSRARIRAADPSPKRKRGVLPAMGKVQPTFVADICSAMETIAPTGLAQSWDNVGLLAGDPKAEVHRALACIDLTPPVVEEAIKKKIDLLLAYHPPIFKPVSSLRADSRAADAAVFRCIQNGIAIYATHTALDAAEGGTNDVIASLCGIKQTEPLEYVDDPSVDQCKLVVFVPADQLEKIADAMFSAGAGHIGEYGRCSYRTTGQGTFFGGKATSPSIGQRGRIQYVDEVRLETIVPFKAVPGVVNAMIKAHSYEEPAFDIYPLRSRPLRGIGRVGNLARAVTLRSLARRLKRATQAACVQIVGPQDRMIERAAILVGAIGGRELELAITSASVGSAHPTQEGNSRDGGPCPPYPEVVNRGGEESASAKNPRGLKPAARRGYVIITGEIRHHDALTIRRTGGTAIALGHWASERPVLASLARRLQEQVPGLSAHVSSADVDPFHPV